MVPVSLCALVLSKHPVYRLKVSLRTLFILATIPFLAFDPTLSTSPPATSSISYSLIASTTRHPCFYLYFDQNHAATGKRVNATSIHALS
ncbi:hypothetical protein C0993_006672 [Termitomyces sp. T159_Od127]|nr:hypothetical protein C0993_006672 [Termitomyces sp. T159_Od127]